MAPRLLSFLAAAVAYAVLVLIYFAFQAAVRALLGTWTPSFTLMHTLPVAVLLLLVTVLLAASRHRQEN